ncbi:MAG: type II toxin-antitoxin system VapC family toxin [Propionibacteriaceae bacterium]|nr:type II toxin-antitoxin system VapC family toxin [Propionibacteriaceae bacterium]
MLDTNICSFLMRHQPSVGTHLLQRVSEGSIIAISAITYSELRDGALGPKVSPKHAYMVDELVRRVDTYAWDINAVDHTAMIRAHLRNQGTPIGLNDSAIAGHALSINAVLVSNNTREFSRVPKLRLEDWTLSAP